MKNYIVGVTIHNAFHIEAETPEDARQQVRDMDTLDLMHDSDFNITYTDEQNAVDEEDDWCQACEDGTCPDLSPTEEDEE